jgi:type IV secretory pathway VirB2 component (pilin)
VNIEPNLTAPNVFTAAVSWLDQLVLGSVAQTIAVIAVASVGLLLLSGRIDVRRGVQVIVGCFLVFGASSIASGIMTATEGTRSPPIAESSLPPTPPAPVAVAAVPYDPYAGAAMPTRQ